MFEPILQFNPMLFNYTTVDEKGQETQGSIDAINVDVAIAGLQRRGLIVASIHEAGKGGSILSMNISWRPRLHKGRGHPVAPALDPL